MVTVPHIMVRLERMLDYRGVGLASFHCTYSLTYIENSKHYCMYTAEVTDLAQFLIFGILKSPSS